MSAGKGPRRDKRPEAAIVDGLLEDLFFSDPGSKQKSGKQPRPSGSAPKPIQQPRPSGSAPKPISQPRPSGSAPRPISQPRPSGSAPMPISQRRPSAPVRSVAQPGGNARVGTWGRISLGVLVSVAMLQWPYDHSCGLDLGFYLTAVAMVLVTAGWASAGSWKNRMPVAHSVSHILLLWGFVLGAGQVLPRVGYAKDFATWRCAVPAAVAPAIVPSISRETGVAGEGVIPAE